MKIEYAMLKKISEWKFSQSPKCISVHSATPRLCKSQNALVRYSDFSQRLFSEKQVSIKKHSVRMQANAQQANQRVHLLLCTAEFPIRKVHHLYYLINSEEFFIFPTLLKRKIRTFSIQIWKLAYKHLIYIIIFHSACTFPKAFRP